MCVNIIVSQSSKVGRFLDSVLNCQWYTLHMSKLRELHHDSVIKTSVVTVPEFSLMVVF